RIEEVARPRRERQGIEDDVGLGEHRVQVAGPPDPFEEIVVARRAPDRGHGHAKVTRAPRRRPADGPGPHRKEPLARETPGPPSADRNVVASGANRTSATAPAASIPGR